MDKVANSSHLLRCGRALRWLISYRKERKSWLSIQTRRKERQREREDMLSDRHGKPPVWRWTASHFWQQNTCDCQQGSGQPQPASIGTGFHCHSPSAALLGGGSPWRLARPASQRFWPVSVHSTVPRVRPWLQRARDSGFWVVVRWTQWSDRAERRGSSSLGWHGFNIRRIVSLPLKT